ncbi:cytokinin dehydrogenase 7 [Selaginella moellendorffii]|uniref:cytokinin dehydrogenase 7 n=1 Tax=Selaginella moellendorffii TaxID=88036 RepID=UPI000D1C23CE|nr:cytokinin dehydrogenase 7 [Selaginella moellendorffii]|eukprot:XP_024538326.1 cytokinin dehydrogenase 7 [Selaginella moellendorffii]
MGKVKLKSREVARKSSDQDSESLNSQDAARDFGGLIHSPPYCVVCPSSSDGISSLVRAANATAKLTIAARGNGHSVHGQAQALNGIVIDMPRMPTNAIRIVNPIQHHDHHQDHREEIHQSKDHGGGDDDLFCGGPFVEASGGVLWIDVLRETLKCGLAPRTWTDYLYLSVGGTLSNAGVSGQAFRHGPQISNVLQLQVVTGNGDTVTCSATRNSDLFYAVLGGLGQFGIITKARIPLEEAPARARYKRLVYTDFGAFQKDIERLISLNEDVVNYVEGIVIPSCDDPYQGYNSVPFDGEAIDPSLIPDSSGPVLYCIEIAKYYNHGQEAFMEDRLERLLGSLSFVPGLTFTTDLTYFDFLNRVHGVEEVLRKVKQWDVPHPWLALFVPKSKISKFNDIVFRDMVCKGVNGPMLIYPLNRSKWETRSSVVVPDESIFYIVCLLRYVVEGGQPLEAHLQQNEEIMRRCEINGLNVKQYFPHYHSDTEWKQHFGESWGKFLANKIKYDPNAILSPGQGIFARDKVAVAAAKQAADHR